MRHESADSDPEPTKLGLRHERSIVDGVAQAPNGVWYATIIRREYRSGVKGQVQLTEETWTFSIDFKAEIPDHLFKVDSSQR